MDGIKRLADGIAKEFQRLLPKQRKSQRTHLSLLVATMLDVRSANLWDVRSANLMDLAAGLPREAGRIGPERQRRRRYMRYMRYHWSSRVLMNPPD